MTPSVSLRPFQCGTCGRAFTKNDHLLRHLRSHTKEKPYKCHSCGNQYSRSDVLSRHLKDVRCAGVPKPGSDSAQGCRVTSKHHRGNGDESGATAGYQHGGSFEVLNASGEHAAQPQAYDAFPGSHPSQPGTLHDPITASPLSSQPMVAPEPVENGSQPYFPVADSVYGGNDLFSSFHDLDIFQMLPRMSYETHFPSPGREVDTSHYNAELNFETATMPSADEIELAHAQSIEKIWFTRLTEPPTEDGYPTRLYTRPCSPSASAAVSPGPKASDVTEQHRQRYQNRLRIISYEPTVPSTEVLNILIRLYFSNVHRIFPIIHAPTFRPSAENASLAIIMCATGSLFTGSPDGLRQAFYLTERLHKSLVMNWERLLAQKQDSLLIMTQVALIGSFFGILSSSARLFLTIRAFFGLPLAWSATLGLHKVPSAHPVDLNVGDDLLDQQWRVWAQAQERIRVAHALYLVDSEVASLSHGEPFQNFERYGFGCASSEASFEAKSCSEWKSILARENAELAPEPIPVVRNLQSCTSQALMGIPAHSTLTAYTILEAISVHLMSAQGSFECSSGPSEHFQSLLIAFYRHFLMETGTRTSDTLQLRILWHSVFLASLTNVDLLEHAVGRDGRNPSEQELDAIYRWTSSGGASRCALHCLMVYSEIERISLMREFALHTPRTLFWAGLILFSLQRYGRTTLQSVSNLDDYPELQLSIRTLSDGNSMAEADLISDLQQITNGTSLFSKTVLQTNIDLLEHHGHWGITRKFASILRSLCEFESGRNGGIDACI